VSVCEPERAVREYKLDVIAKLAANSSDQADVVGAKADRMRRE